MRDDVAIVNGKRETNIPVVYGAGDFIDHNSKVRLISRVLSDGVLLNSEKAIY